MATLFTDDFEAGSNGAALAGGWTTAGNGNVTYTTAQAHAGTKSVHEIFNASHDGGVCYPTGIQDGAGGEAQATCWYNARDWTASLTFQLFCRMTTPATAIASIVAYFVEFIGGSPPTLKLRKANPANTFADIGSVTLAGWNNSWCKFILKTQGATISVRVQRISDDNWLTSSGTWQSSAVDAISVTDSAITLQGYAGFRLVTDNSGYVDDFLFESLAGGGTTHNVSCAERASAVIVISE